ncbi:MAG: DUF3299 domain-containing protein [Sulfurimonas sp.]|nr:DUF3299 domain-containing protein [Sulfurimonas sp.]
MKKSVISIFVLFLFVACSGMPDYEVDNWEILIDPNFDQEKVVSYYKDKVSKVKPWSQEEIDIYAELQEALKDAGNNKAVDGKRARLSGFIVPVDTEKDKVNKFLFFPTQAACIHVPASPANQTIYVETKADEGVILEDAYEEVTVYGKLILQEAKVATGTASYIINDGICRVYPK